METLYSQVKKALSSKGWIEEGGDSFKDPVSGKVFDMFVANDILEAREEGRWAWYSAKAAAKYGSVTYNDENFNPIEVTSVQNECHRENNKYGWDDKVDVGRVLNCIKAHSYVFPEFYSN